MIEVSVPVWVKGTVVHYEIVNPHTTIELEEKLRDGQIRRWTVEGPIPSRVQRMGVGANFLEPGDVVEVCGFHPKTFAATGDPPPYIHGHVLVMPDGRMSPWGPYGTTENCVRPQDRVQAWVDFLNGDVFARELWCNGESEPNVAATKVAVAEIHRVLATPCP
jgi:hypothetical protein